MLKITSMCFSVKTRSYLLKNTERTQKFSLHQFSTKLTRAELVKTRALFAGYIVTSTIHICSLHIMYSNKCTINPNFLSNHIVLSCPLVTDQGDDITPEPYMQITSNPLPPLPVLSWPPPPITDWVVALSCKVPN